MSTPEKKVEQEFAQKKAETPAGSTTAQEHSPPSANLSTQTSPQIIRPAPLTEQQQQFAYLDLLRNQQQWQQQQLQWQQQQFAYLDLLRTQQQQWQQQQLQWQQERQQYLQQFQQPPSQHLQQQSSIQSPANFSYSSSVIPAAAPHSATPFNMFSYYTGEQYDKGEDSDDSCESIASFGAVDDVELEINPKKPKRIDAPVMSPDPEDVGGKPTQQQTDEMYNQSATPSLLSEKARIELPDWNALSKNPDELARRMAAVESSFGKTALQDTEMKNKQEDAQLLNNMFAKPGVQFAQFTATAQKTVPGPATSTSAAPVGSISDVSDTEKKQQDPKKQKTKK